MNHFQQTSLTGVMAREENAHLAPTNTDHRATHLTRARTSIAITSASRAAWSHTPELIHRASFTHIFLIIADVQTPQIAPAKFEFQLKNYTRRRVSRSWKRCCFTFFAAFHMLSVSHVRLYFLLWRSSPTRRYIDCSGLFIERQWTIFFLFSETS